MESRVYQFGPFRLEARTRLLLRDDVLVPITPKAAETLVVLVENSGSIVTKEELLSAVWPDTAVEATNLTQNISLLRKALGDDPEGHSYIETIPKRGYRFRAPVQQLAETPAQPAMPAPLPAPSQAMPPSPPSFPQPAMPPPPALSSQAVSRVRRGVRLAWLALGAVLLTGGILSALHFRNIGVGEPLEIVPLSGEAGMQVYPAFSPDGSQVAFSWDGEEHNNLDIYIRPVGSGERMRLTTDSSPDCFPAWSPDGSAIAFRRALADRTAPVFIIPAGGGLERKLAVLYPVGYVGSASGELTWSPDGKWLVVAGRTTQNEAPGLWAVSTATQQARRLTTVPAGQLADTGPIFSPDGHKLAFVRVSSFGISEIFLLSVSEQLETQGEPARLTFDAVTAAGPAWSPDGSEILYCSNRSGSSMIWRVPVSNPLSFGIPALRSSPRPLPGFGERVDHLSVSTNSNTLVYSRLAYQLNVWSLALTAPASAVRKKAIPDSLPRPVDLISSSRDQFFPQYSPDGRQVSFQSNRSGRWEIWTCQSNGSNCYPLTSMKASYTAGARWSPDGRWIAFTSRLGGKPGIYVVHPEGGPPRRVTPPSMAASTPSWSHDRKWIYFAAVTRRRHEVWKVPVEGGDPIQVTRQGGFAALESLDGKDLYYSKELSPNTSLWKIPVGGGPETQVLPSIAYGLNFVLVEDGIYFVPIDRPEWFFQQSMVEQIPTVQFYHFATGAVRAVVRLDKPMLTGLSVSPDGRSLLYSQIDYLASELTLVRNFR